ncbi:DUF645 family protein [Vibrio cholerae]|nr:DUF645 family protein [Vibrio cholerae]EKF9139857.1 DUF645 family protein [Vibrio cholerae]
MLSDAPHGKFSITKAASSLKLFFLCRGLLTFWQPTSQLLALDVCLRDAFA